jgi:hypothetical protein
MFNYSIPSSSNTWQDRLKEIKIAREHYSQHEALMTPYEREMRSKEIHQKLSAYYPTIYSGVKKAWDGWINAYKNATVRLAEAKAKEYATWDPTKLGAEMQTFRALVDQRLTRGKEGAFGSSPAPSEGVKKLYQEYQNSGDPYKKRASSEVMLGISTHGLSREDAVNLRILGHEAESNLLQLRNTEEIQKAEEAYMESAQELFKQRAQLSEVASLVGEPPDTGFGSGNITKLQRMVQVERETGEIKLYTLEDPQVTGIYWITDPNSVPNPFTGGEND